MLCDNCKKREATVRYEESINGKNTKINLCSICSQKIGIINNNFMDNMLFSFFDEPLSIDYNKVKEESCPKCGYTFSDYAKTGLLGCANCYNTFESKLTPILKKLHGKECHVKEENIKKVKKDINKGNNEIEVLKNELKHAIEKEEYEKAAILRDKIKDLQERGEV